MAVTALSIKSQKICPVLLAESGKFSFALAEEVHFAVFSCEAGSLGVKFTTQVLQNILSDTFNHSLNFNENMAVLPVLEEAVSKCKEAVLKLDAQAKFSAVAALFKDDFVYVVIYGSCKALYLDGTQLAHVDTDSEGQFASGVQKIDEDKVMILCTEEFFKKYPPKSLIALDKPISAQELKELSSAVILKVDYLEKKETLKAENKVKNNLNSSLKEKIKLPSWSQKFVKLTPAFLAGVGVLFIGYIIVRFLSSQTGLLRVAEVNNNKSAQSPGSNSSLQNGENSQKQGDQELNDKQVQNELSKKLDEANKVQRVKPQVFYDISITDSKFTPSEIAQGKNYLAVCDFLQGKIYISKKDVAKFEELPQLFPGVKNLQFDGDILVFTDNEGVKFYAINTKSVNKSYLISQDYTPFGPSAEYLGFTYAIVGDKLYKFTKAGSAFTATLWSQKEEFKNAVSMDIDGSIYVLFADGTLEKYTVGTKADFSVIGLDKPIKKPLKVVADSNFKQVYVGDGEEGRILVFDEDGVLKFQIKPELGLEWTALKSFDIAADEKTFYVLSGTKVFEFKL